MKRISLFSLFFVVYLLSSWLCAQESESPLKTTLYFPQWADGGGFSTSIQLTNLLRTHGGKATVRFFSQGEEVNIETNKGISPLEIQFPPAGTLSLATRGGRDSPLITGWCAVEAQVRIAGTLTYHYPFGQTTVTASPTWRAFTIIAEYERGAKNTGIALANPGASSTSVIFRLIDAGGTSIGPPQTLTLSSRAHRAVFVHELFRNLQSQEDFQGTVEIVSQRNIIALSIGYSSFPDGRYLIDNSPAQPTRYQNVEQVQKSAVQAVYFVPRDVPVDPDYKEGIRFIAESTLQWFDIELMRGGGIGGLSSLVDFVRNEERLVDVDLVIGEETAAFYESQAANSGHSRKMVEELGSHSPLARILFVAHQANFSSDWGSAYATGWSNGTDEWLLAIFPGPHKFVFQNSFSTYTEEYLYGLHGSVSRDDMARADIFIVTYAAAHELGHNLGVNHSELLESAFPGQYRNLMNCCTGAGPGWGIGFWAATLMPGIPTGGLPMQNLALDAGEIASVVSIWPR